jgi:colicin import membrane protein
MAASAQNTWEMPTQANNSDAKYLVGAVPVIDGKVTFKTTVEAPGKTADQVADIVRKYMKKMTTEPGQFEQSRIVLDDSLNHQVIGSYQEWLVFKSTALMLDRTRMLYVITARCSDGKAEIAMKNIRYAYEENRKPQHYTAEEWISDKEALNKKGTRLLPLSGKFRRKTIDRKDFLFNKFESLLK